MPAQWRTAPEVEEIAQELIELYHTHLAGEKIRFVFINEARKKNGQAIWGRAMKKSNFDGYLQMDEDDVDEFNDGAEFFVMEIAYDIWEQLKDSQKKALADHELTHFWLDDNGRHVILPHDLEEFTAIVGRHGIDWRDNLQQFGNACIRWSGQHTLDFTHTETGETGDALLEAELMAELKDPAVVRRCMLRLGKYLPGYRPEPEESLPLTPPDLPSSVTIPASAKKTIQKMADMLKREGSTMTIVSGGKSATIGAKKKGGIKEEAVA